MSDALTFTASEARARFADVFDTAFFGRVVIVTKGKRRVAFVPMGMVEELVRLERIAARDESAPATGDRA